jgi:hypothetical protein
MAETDVEQGTSTNGAQGQGEQIAQKPDTQQPSPEVPAAPTPPEGHAANRSRGKIIACLALVGGGALAAIRRARRARASHKRRGHWPVVPAMPTRIGRSRRAASGARARKRRCR